MRILRAELIRLPLELAAPYEIATERVEAVENLVLRLVSDGPHVGLGVAAPDETVTGETHDACAAALSGLDGLIAGLDPTRRTQIDAEARPALAALPAARAALNLALYDLLGKAAGLSVWQLLGGFRDSMPTSITVFLDAPEEMARQAEDFHAQGFNAIKLKGGRAVEQDIEVVRRVREAVGPGVELRFDANQGWTAPQALAFIAAVGDELELLEQPTLRGQAEALGRVTRGSPIPVMADESVHNLSDVFRLARGERVDMVNVKLMKVGGIDPALAIDAVARAAGLELMVGCGDECALAIAAGLHFALARPNVRYADLDGHLDLIDDPSAGLVVIDEGVLKRARGLASGWSTFRA